MPILLRVRLYIETVFPFLAVALLSVALLFSDPSIQSWLKQWNWTSVREWVSALSGWAAAFAAIATLFVIVRQNRDSERRHRENLAFQQIELLNIAKKTKATLNASKVRSEPLADAFGKMDEETFKQNYQQILNALTDLAEWFDDDAIDEFERRVQTDNPNDLIGLRRHLDKALDFLDTWANERRYLLRREDIKRISTDITKYCEARMANADAFIARHQRLLE